MYPGDRAAGELLAAVLPGGVVVADVTVRVPTGDGIRGLRETVSTYAAVRLDEPERGRLWKITGAHRPYTTGDLLMMSQDWTVTREGRP